MSSGELKSLAAKGDIDRASLVWCDGLTDWVQAGTVKGLFAGPPPVPEAQPQQQSAITKPPERVPISEYEIKFDREKMMARGRKFLYATLAPVILFASLTLIVIVSSLVYGDGFGRGGFGEFIGFLMGPIGLVIWVVLWKNNRKYWQSVKYSIVNDVLLVQDYFSTTRIPLARITDVRYVTLKYFEQLVVQTAGSGRAEAILCCVEDPEAVTAMLVSKQA